MMNDRWFSLIFDFVNVLNFDAVDRLNAAYSLVSLTKELNDRKMLWLVKTKTKLKMGSLCSYEINSIIYDRVYLNLYPFFSNDDE